MEQTAGSSRSGAAIRHLDTADIREPIVPFPALLMPPMRFVRVLTGRWRSGRITLAGDEDNIHSVVSIDGGWRTLRSEVPKTFAGGVDMQPAISCSWHERRFRGKTD
jgi:hypothetical protein